jgi:phytoene/squalene synthetase
MSVYTDDMNAIWNQSSQSLSLSLIQQAYPATESLATSITKAASKQTFYTIRFLVDQDRVEAAYQAYAYFRWVDDRLDQKLSHPAEQIAFVERQQTLIDRCYRDDWPHRLRPEERLLIELLQTDTEAEGGLGLYIRHMMAVMAFDAERRGKLISAQELHDYSLHLSTAVTEALHYFIGHDDPTPQTEARYLAVMGAHVTHMLRDTLEDIAAGYFNIPREFVESHGIDPADVDSDAYREWVKSRVELARDYFKAGADYLSQIKSQRCRIAGYAYMARFKGVLDTIEREGYRLRAEYPERKRLSAVLGMGRFVLASSLWFTPSGHFATS